MSQYMAALYSQIYGLCLDVSLLEYCDPSSLHVGNIADTCNKVHRICDIVLSPLLEQNRQEACALSLELSHLLINLRARLLYIYQALLDPSSYFSKLHSTVRLCNLHKRIAVNFYNKCSVDINLTLLNDVEQFLSRLNCVFYCLSASDALQAMEGILEFVQHLRGISPIPPTNLYIVSSPCLECLTETSVLPNRGETVKEMMVNHHCYHLVQQVPPEPIQGLFESELRHLGASIDFASTTSEASHSEQGALLQESLAYLKDHTIFNSTSKQILELSNLIYWNASQQQPGEADVKCSELSKILQRETDLHKYRAFCSQNRALTHYFDLYRPSHIEILFCAGVFSSTDDTIGALKKDCSNTFMKQSKLASLTKKQNELFNRLSCILYGGAAAPSPQDKPETSALQACSKFDASKNQVLQEAAVRKDAYLNKLSKEGFKRLQECLHLHEEVLNSQLSLKIWGSALYKHYASLLNHFLFRQRWVASAELPPSVNRSAEQFENSKFVKNSLFATNLSREHLSTLRLQFFSLINGPLTSHRGLFPVPQNVQLAYCLDAANFMPHQKMLLNDMIKASMEPRDWICSNFNEFYTIYETDLNSIQYECWKYVRELVLSVALYNITWEKKLRIYKTDRTQVPANMSRLNEGLYLTYESSAPLVLVHSNKKWIFKDLYALLYTHMQLEDNGEPR
ncbi:ORF7 [Ovine gammaherpesvirus 2]|uniref:ORF7 n=1 Tax=Ovine gammaherpesvirus 2 TaxID=10398 RepID=Q2VSN0_9GAMA|nr:ORF7 [Ovine gammaherpesvirus 2]AAX58046.1 ORF7 [Ovine gammaherpesvirus 2]